MPPRDANVPSRNRIGRRPLQLKAGPQALRGSDGRARPGPCRAYSVGVPFDGAFSPLHWVVIGVVALLVISPSQLPVVAKRAGQLMRDAQRFRQHLHAELRDVVSEFDLHGEAPSDRGAE